MKNTFITKLKPRNVIIALYVLLVLAFSATAKAEMSTMPVIGNGASVQTKIFHGEVAVSDDNRFFLAGVNGKDYELVTDEDLSNRVGHLVEIQGFELKTKVKQNGNHSPSDPLNGDSTFQRVYPKIVVIDIREIYQTQPILK